MHISAAASGPSGQDEPSVDCIRAYLSNALEMMDALGTPPEIGARLQEVIDSIEQFALANPDHERDSSS